MTMKMMAMTIRQRQQQQHHHDIKHVMFNIVDTLRMMMIAHRGENICTPKYMEQKRPYKPSKHREKGRKKKEEDEEKQRRRRKKKNVVKLQHALMIFPFIMDFLANFLPVT